MLQKNKFFLHFIKTLISLGVFIFIFSINIFPQGLPDNAQLNQGNNEEVLEEDVVYEDVREEFDEQEILNNQPRDMDEFHQLYSGAFIYAFGEHPYFQFAGEKVYKNGAAPLSFTFDVLLSDEESTNLVNSFNIGYEYVLPMDLRDFDESLTIFSAYSFLIEYIHYKLTPTTVLEKGKRSRRSLITMDFSVIDLAARLYFGKPINSTVKKVVDFTDYFNPFIGTGWGVINGGFTGKHNTFGVVEEFNTSFTGLTTFREFGILGLQETFGFSLSMRIVKAPKITINDNPFKRTHEGNDFYMDLGGFINILNFVYRF